MDPSEYSLSLFDDDISRWQAVQNRDAIADGFFVYAVKTTKVYCRPICKARLARRSNVSFYSTGDEASKAGFRACKRCKPDILGVMPEERAVQQIRRFIAEQTAARGQDQESMSLAHMARRTGLSKWHFHRVFKKTVGVTPGEYLRQRGTFGGVRPESVASTPWLPLGDLSQCEINGDFNLEALGSILGLEGCSLTSGSGSVSTGLESPLSFDDLLIWPDNDG